MVPSESSNTQSNIFRLRVDKILSEEAVALKIINKINGRLKFLYRKNRYLILYPKQLLHKTLINYILIMPVQLCIQI